MNMILETETGFLQNPFAPFLVIGVVILAVSLVKAIIAAKKKK